MDAAALQQFLDEHFPQAKSAGFTIDQLDHERLTLRLPCDTQHLRPGGTISGPVQMMLADSAMYLALLARLGPVALAVTSSLEIHFLRKAGVGDLLAEARLIKLGKRLAVGLVELREAGAANEPPTAARDRGLLAHATVTYSLPDSPPVRHDHRPT